MPPTFRALAEPSAAGGVPGHRSGAAPDGRGGWCPQPRSLAWQSRPGRGRPVRALPRRVAAPSAVSPNYPGPPGRKRRDSHFTQTLCAARSSFSRHEPVPTRVCEPSPGLDLADAGEPFGQRGESGDADGPDDPLPSSSRLTLQNGLQPELAICTGSPTLTAQDSGAPNRQGAPPVRDIPARSPSVAMVG
jgi:hypothetical protein